MASPRRDRKSDSDRCTPRFNITNSITAGLTAVERARGLLEAAKREHGLNAQQAIAVGWLLENPDLGIEEFEGLCPKANKRTLQRDLQGLVQRKLVTLKGAARAARYQLRIRRL